MSVVKASGDYPVERRCLICHLVWSTTDGRTARAKTCGRVECKKALRNQQQRARRRTDEYRTPLLSGLVASRRVVAPKGSVIILKSDINEWFEPKQVAQLQRMPIVMFHKIRS